MGIQIIKCKCGKTFAACAEPMCYEDAEWQKEMRAYVKKGCTVSVVEAGTWQFESCVCNEKGKDLAPQLQLAID